MAGCADMLQAALTYAKMGLAVIPLQGKIPIYKNWPEVATTDSATIQRWFHQTPNANLGIATGKRSNVFVVDIDPRHGGSDSWEHELVMHEVPVNTWQDITGGGGLHVWFKYPGFPVKTCAGLLPGVDIRGDGGQVVAPPSIHPDTHKLYEWEGLKPIWEQPLIEAPDWLLRLLHPKEHAKDKPHLPDRIPHGVQHQTLVSFAGQLRRMGLSPDEIFPSLMHVNETRCEQPGPEKNIRQIAQSMAKYQPSDRALYAEANRLWNLTRYYEERKVQEIKSSGLVDAYTLLKNPPQPPVEVIEGILFHGSTICAGRPKAGKSWLALQMAISVSVGAPFMGWCRVKSPGGVLYGALEESPALTARRLAMLTQEGNVQLQNLHFFYSVPDGGLESLAKMIVDFKPALVVIDTYLALYKNLHSQSKDILAEDYAKIDWVTQIAKRAQTAIVLIHHTRKDSAGQGLDAVIGTSGTTANAECIWTIDRKPERKAELRVTGRHAAEAEFLMSLDITGGTGWTVDETGEDVHFTDTEAEIAAVLREIGSGSAKQLSVELRKSPAAMRMALRRMHTKGKVTKFNDSYKLSGGQEE